MLTRDRRRRGLVERYTTTTKADGSYRIKVRAAASRLTQIAWRSHVNDPGFQETAYVTLLARASASLKATPRSVGVGGRVRLSGTAPRHDPRARRPADLPGPHRATGRYTTFADGRANRKGRFLTALPLPLGRLARADVPLPREAPRRRPLPVRARLIRTVTVRVR